MLLDPLNSFFNSFSNSSKMPNRNSEAGWGHLLRMCVIFCYLFQKRLRELELEVNEEETDLEDQARETVDDLIKKKDRIAKMEELQKAQLDEVVEEINLADEDAEIVCVCNIGNLGRYIDYLG